MDKIKFEKRSDIPEALTWDLSSLYVSDSDWENDCSKVRLSANKMQSFENRTANDGQTLLDCLKLHDEIELTLERIYVYARMKKDENNTESKYQGFLDKSRMLISEVSASISFLIPELSNISEEIIQKFFEEKPELLTYSHFFDVIKRHKSHILSSRDEEILAEFSQLTSCPEDVFTMINNADMDFGYVKNSHGEDLPLTHGSYISYLESTDPVLRKNAFKKLYSQYEKLKNTLAQTYSYSVKTNVVTSRLRNYSSPLKAALFGDNISEKVYKNLVDTINQNLNILHRYMALKKKVCGLHEMHMYDIYIPFENTYERYIPFEEAVDIMKSALLPLGDEYIKNVEKAVNSRWIDVYESPGKTSGAYSFGSYDSNPYILLNYNGKLKDVFTLVHEMGHSMHSFYTRANQPFAYGGHSIFTAEVASTVNENLLMHYLINNSENNSERKYLYMMHLEEFRGTVFRQTMFAEFEAIAHHACQNGEVLTCEYLCEIYNELNSKYMGDNVYHDNEIALEWSRIPHFYSAFYVYKYATGYLAASFIAQKILSGNDKDRMGYLEFLKSGNSNYPIDLLKLAGVDMQSPEPINAGLSEFKKILNELEKLYY